MAVSTLSIDWRNAAIFATASATSGLLCAVPASMTVSVSCSSSGRSQSWFAIAHAYKTTARMSLGEVPLQHNRGFRAHRHRLVDDVQQILKLAWRGCAHGQHVAG